MPVMTMRRFQMMLDEELDEQLEARAAEEGVSKAELLRRYARERLSPSTPVEDDPIWEMVGADDGPDLAQDEYTGRTSEHKNAVLYGDRR